MIQELQLLEKRNPKGIITVRAIACLRSSKKKQIMSFRHYFLLIAIACENGCIRLTDLFNRSAVFNDNYLLITMAFIAYSYNAWLVKVSADQRLHVVLTFCCLFVGC